MLLEELCKNKTVKGKAFDSSSFHSKSRFQDDVTQNYLVFPPVYKYFKSIVGSNHILAWKSKGLSDESIKPLSAYGNSLNPVTCYIGNAKTCAASLCLANISKYLPINNMKKTGLYGYIYDFSIDYDNVGVDDILDIPKHLMKKHNIK